MAWRMVGWHVPTVPSDELGRLHTLKMNIQGLRGPSGAAPETNPVRSGRNTLPDTCALLSPPVKWGEYHFLPAQRTVARIKWGWGNKMLR